ncbi:MAG: hypothetical protein AB7U20_11915 [Planctomycetaceae bacterium]
MRENITIELDPQQRNYLLAGLRYVRSSIALEIVDWSEEVEHRRQSQYGDLDSLEAILNGSSRAEKPARV